MKTITTSELPCLIVHISLTPFQSKHYFNLSRDTGRTVGELIMEDAEIGRKEKKRVEAKREKRVYRENEYERL